MTATTHAIAHRNWWNGQVTAWCGQTFKPGEGETVIFTSTSCPACKKAKKAAKR